MPENPPANWLTYHLVHPGPGRAEPGDPNCAFYWKGRYHLHYTSLIFGHAGTTQCELDGAKRSAIRFIQLAENHCWKAVIRG
jgi:hypothetical protein